MLSWELFWVFQEDLALLHLEQATTTLLRHDTRLTLIGQSFELDPRILTILPRIQAMGRGTMGIPHSLWWVLACNGPTASVLVWFVP